MSGNTRGFASMDPEARKANARLGGQTAHKKGTAHQWSPEEAKAAGRKGGLRGAAKRGAAKQLANGGDK